MDNQIHTWLTSCREDLGLYRAATCTMWVNQPADHMALYAQGDRNEPRFYIDLLRKAFSLPLFNEHA